jgi:hypothetical protein
MIKRSFQASAFTILELLVSVAVVSIILIVIAAILDGAYRTTGSSRKRLLADEEARRALDRIGMDIKNMIIRKDVDFFFRKQPGNDEMYFFSHAPAHFSGNGTREPVSLIGYRVGGGGKMERFGHGLAWEQATPQGMVFLTPTGDGSMLPGSTIQGAFGSLFNEENKYQVIGSGIFRFEVKFLLKASGNLSMRFSESPYRDASLGAPFSNNGNALSDVEAIQVAIMVLDDESQKILPNLSSLESLASKFPDDSAEVTEPLNEWEILSTDTEEMGIPLSAASQIRVYRRLYPVKSFTP